ncbi:MAG TPA: haloacid dehalogenase type II [Pirellulales bacterium]|nr:haloacid dehalogenase type II [Pirellulales bacterium]
MAQIIVFDLNGTLLDLAALDPHFARAFGSPQARREWFDLVVQAVLLSVLHDDYQDFSKLAQASLRMLADRSGIVLDPSDRKAILDGLKRLPPFADVVEGLGQLKSAGYRLAVLTNSSRQSAVQLLRRHQLAGFFDAVFSVDEVRRMKPAREPYLFAARRLRVRPSGMRLVAAHAWDIAGAAQAGCATALLARPGQALNPLWPKPGLQAADLIELARKLRRFEK